MKIKIKIAVCVTADGQWNAVGWGFSGGESENAAVLMDITEDPLEGDLRRYWIEAEVETPEPPQSVTTVAEELSR